MPSNQQRREASRRKLQRQLARREERAKARRRWTIVISAVAVVVVVGAAFAIWQVSRGSSNSAADNGSATSTAVPDSPCSYTKTEEYAPAGTTPRKVDAPKNLQPLNKGTVDATITMNGQAVPITLNRTIAPCTVNSFLSLASQHFFDDTSCHRLTDAEGLKILQCGDPTGTGRGGPGYMFPDETQNEQKYTVGTLAMANAGIGTGTNGSQFFIVYGPSSSLSGYTIFGQVSTAGMKVIDEVTAKGVQQGAQDGKPVAKAVIDTVTVPADSLEGTGDYATTTASTPASAAPTSSATESSTDTAPATGSATESPTDTTTAAATTK